MRDRHSRIAFAALGALVALSSASAARAQSPTTAAERATAWSQHQALDRASPFRGLAWRPVGPVRIGARVEAIAIPPGNTGTIYVGVGSGNLWKTVSNGLTWRAIFEHESAFAIGDVEVAPSDPRIVWVGTGEAQPRYAGYAYPGTGVFNVKATLYHAGAKGVGVLDSLGCKVVPMRTLAVDKSIIPRRTVVFIKETVGLKMPDGQAHDGYWYASDIGGAIKGQRVDLYTGHNAASMKTMRQLNLSTLTAVKVGQFKGCPPH